MSGQGTNGFNLNNLIDSQGWLSNEVGGGVAGDILNPSAVMQNAVGGGTLGNIINPDQSLANFIAPHLKYNDTSKPQVTQTAAPAQYTDVSLPSSDTPSTSSDINNNDISNTISAFLRGGLV